MAGPADNPFEGCGFALRTGYLHFFIGTDEEFLKKIAAFEASEFKNRHSLFSSIQGFKGFWNTCYARL
jgi:hypothetical protein